MSHIFIAVNQTVSDIDLIQLALTIPSSGQVTLSDFNSTFEIQTDKQLHQLVTDGYVLINNGTTTFNQSESLFYISPVASVNDLTNADEITWTNVALALGGQAGSNDGYVFKSDGYGSGTMVPNTSVIYHSITVGKSGDVDYTSIADAISAAISGGASATSPWQIIVMAGTYVEPPMSLYAGINVIAGSGQRISTAIISPSNPNENLFTCYGGVITGFSMHGVTDPSKYLVYANTAYSLTVLHGVSMWGASNGVYVGNSATVVLTNSAIIIDGPSQSITTGLTATGAGTYLGIAGFFISCPSILLPYYVSNPVQTGFYITNDAECYISTLTARVAPKNSTADVFLVDNGAKLTVLSGEISNSGNAFHIGSSGTSTKVTVQGISFSSNLLNFYSESSTGEIYNITTGDHDYYSAVAGSNIAGISQVRSDKSLDLVGKVNYKYPTNKKLNLQNYFYDYISTGISEGGAVTAGTGLAVNIAAGEGFSRRGSPYFDSFNVSWDSYSNLPLTANSTNYVHYSTLDGYLDSTTSPISSSEILLATVVTNGSGIRYIHQTQNYVTDHINKIQEFLLYTQKFSLKNGLGVVQGTTNHKLNVSSGSYYRGITEISYAGSGGDATWSYFYGTNGATEVASQTSIDHTYYNNSGTLTALTLFYYKTDTLYLTSDGRLNLIYGTSQYLTQVLAEAAPKANIPTFMEQSAVSLANVVIRQGVGIVSIIDLRPVFGGAGASSGGVSLHSALAGLDADDHTQYLLVTGARNMSGSLNMGGNDITNVGNVDGVDISTHASRHNPGGADSLAVGIPVTVSVGATPSNGSASSYSLSDHQHGITAGTPSSIGTANSAGTASSVSRSDHIHNHGNQTNENHHALVVAGTSHGFMSSGDKTKLDGIATGATNLQLTSSSPVDVTKATATAGVATTAARADHKHDISTAAASTLSVGGSNTEGSASSLCRSDHTHALPAFGSSAGTFCQGNDSRLSDDRVASGLRTATTVVSVSSATAPTAGQVLTATSGTAATWQAASAGAIIGDTVSGTTTITTTSTTDVLMTGMTVTPVAGTYLVWFSGEIKHSSNNRTSWLSIYAGGTINSEILSTMNSSNDRQVFTCLATVTVNGAQAIEGRWRTFGTTATNTRRSLMYLKIA